MKKIITLSLAVVLAAFVFVGCSSTPSTPSGAAEKASKCMQDGDFKGLVDMMYFAEKEDATVEEQKDFYFQMLNEKGAQSLEKKGGIDSFKVVSEEIDEEGDDAKVVVEFTYGNGDVDSETQDYEMIDGKWYLSTGK